MYVDFIDIKQKLTIHVKLRQIQTTSSMSLSLCNTCLNTSNQSDITCVFHIAYNSIYESFFELFLKVLAYESKSK